MTDRRGAGLGWVSGRRPRCQLSSLLQMLRLPSIHLFADLRQLLLIGNEGHVHVWQEAHVCRGGFPPDSPDLIFNLRVMDAP